MKEHYMNKTEIYEELAAEFENEGTSEAILMAGLSSEVGEVQAEWAERAMVAEAKLAKLEVRLRVAMDTLRYYNLEVRTPRDPAQHAADMRILKTNGETK